jgi:hypothetical protein
MWVNRADQQTRATQAVRSPIWLATPGGQSAAQPSSPLPHVPLGLRARAWLRGALDVRVLLVVVVAVVVVVVVVAAVVVVVVVPQVAAQAVRAAGADGQAAERQRAVQQPTKATGTGNSALRASHRGRSCWHRLAL